MISYGRQFTRALDEFRVKFQDRLSMRDSWTENNVKDLFNDEFTHLLMELVKITLKKSNA